MEKVTHLEALLFAAVLENCVDQLEILGYIMPISDEDKTDLSHTGIQEMKEIIETQKELDINEPELMSARQESEETVTSMVLKNTEPKQQMGKTEDGKSTHQPSKRDRKHSAVTAEKFRKIEADRQYASDVIAVTMKKMQESGIFNSLTEANEREKEKKSKFYDVLIREEEGKKEIKSLQKQLQDVKRQTAKDLQNRDKIIDRLKDKLQEKTAKLDTESSYMKKDTDLQIHQTQRKCSKEENALNNEIQNLKNQTDEEIQLHTETENFLRQQYQKVEEKLEYWMQKYENDTDAKEVELDDLRALKAENLETMQKFAKECLMFKENIITDRTEKKDRKKQREQDALELKSALKLQAWWKGMMVRRFLGPYQALEKLLKEQAAVQTETGKEKKK
ncbi:dynein regulatory complex protein 9 [Chiroxiphia lanceolata]|uniref:dynein regulatory complex protein 9 n=1 Tax=Chiroxiphia lanceolata TaxID=296741 RepID=UPI0013CEF80E|nr:dynein regulatory complex protein 9 [Chiroxiphia lanceolata]XP_032553379.1 dynein regulatory complex protein 9 [Chiroxiphia lanceolata]XP_032553380.1 dynein regulatory complex protein 9 [Chiroxiphia lanceolata]